MKKLLHKSISFILVLTLVLGLFSGLSFNSSAADLPSSGSCGTNVTYTFNSSTGLLTIGGSGAMEQYSYFNSPFYNQNGIKSIIIDSGVTSIGSYAFRGCSSLKSITIPNSVTSIGESAFYDCSGLTSVIIPNSVTSIGESAFHFCSGLTSVTIPDSVTSIGRGAFYDCISLTSITIPNSVTSIGIGAFNGCSGLTSIIIPNSVTSISSYAFRGCSGLTSVTIGNSVTSIGNGAFSDCSGLTSITIPNSVTSIGNNAFFGCSGLTDVTIPDSVSSIGDYAFYGCSGLTSVTIGNSVSSIGTNAFLQCVSLEKIFFKDLASWCRCGGGYEYLNFAQILSLNNQSVNDIDVLIIPDSANYIRAGAFQNCTRLTSVYIPKSVLSIHKNAFYGCSNIKELTLPYQVNYYNWREARIETQFSEFNTSPIEKITFCDNPTKITDKFNNLFKLKSLKEFEIPESVSYIGDAAFKDCENLTTVTVPKSVTRIEYNAFSGCTNLTVRGYKDSCAETFCKWAGIPFEVIEEPHVHSFAATVTAPTCTEQGFTTHTCSCGESYVDTYISALGHNTEAKTVVKPTGIQLGYTVHSCSRCGEKQKVDSYTAPTGKLKLKHSARTNNAIKVTWNNVKSATGYQVQISTKDGKKWSTCANLKAGVTNYTFKKLAAGNNYKFRVRFFIKAADGKNYYSPWSATLNSPTLPTGTTLTKLTAAKKAFNAQWKKNASVNGYQVQYGVKSNFSGAKTLTVKNTKTLKAAVKKLSAKKIYYVRIRTYKTVSKANYFSTWSKAVKVKTK